MLNDLLYRSYRNGCGRSNRLYHIEHASRPLTERRLKELMDRDGIPMLLWPQIEANQMHCAEKPKNINGNMWRLGSTTS